MFRILKNKLLTAFMIFGALTQQVQATEKHAEERHVVLKSFRIPRTGDDEPISLHGMFREQEELERAISFEFGERFRKVAEESLITGDNSGLKKIRKERDEILAKRQKEWDEGTFDKLAEAKRWAEYLEKRAKDQELVNYPIDVGKPPFPIDMSILSSAESKTPAANNISEIKTSVAGTPKTSLEDVEETLHLLLEDNPPTSGTKDYNAPQLSPQQDVLDALAYFEGEEANPSQQTEAVISDPQPVVVAQKEPVAENVEQEKVTNNTLPVLDDILHLDTQQPPVQQDLIDALAYFEEEEAKSSQQAETVISDPQPVVAAQEEPVAETVEQEKAYADTVNISVAELGKKEIESHQTAEATQSSQPIIASQMITPTLIEKEAEEWVTTIEQKENKSHTDAEELLALLEKETTTPDPKRTPILPIPCERIGLIGLGMLAMSALKRPGSKKLNKRAPSNNPQQMPIIQEKKDTKVISSVQCDDNQNHSSPATIFEDVLPITPITQKGDTDGRNLLAQRLHAVRLMEDIKRERSKLSRQMARAKADNDSEQIQTIKSYRSALNVIRKEAFETAAGPALKEIKDERRLLTKKMTQARRKKDAGIMAEITQRRALLKQKEQQLKSVVREFKYKKERIAFLPTKIAERAREHKRERQYT